MLAACICAVGVPSLICQNIREGLHGYCEDAGMPLQMAEASLLKEQHQDDDDELCIVCWEKAREVIFFHCMHMVRSCQSPTSEDAHIPARFGHTACSSVTAGLPEA